MNRPDLAIKLLAHAKIGQELAEKYNLRDRKVTHAYAAPGRCLESWPCQHPRGYWIDLDDGSKEQFEELSSASFAFFVQALGYKDVLDPHCKKYLDIENSL